MTSNRSLGATGSALTIVGFNYPAPASIERSNVSDTTYEARMPYFTGEPTGLNSLVLPGTPVALNNLVNSPEPFRNETFVGYGLLSNNLVIAAINSTSLPSTGIVWYTNNSTATISSSYDFDLTSSYSHVTQVLSELHESADVDWKIETPVYDASVRVAAMLMEINIPEPAVMTHGPKSVVFNWSRGDTNVYLTVSKTKLYVMASSSEGIQIRRELTDSVGDNTNRFLYALGYAGFLSPPEQKSLPKARG